MYIHAGRGWNTSTAMHKENERTHRPMHMYIHLSLSLYIQMHNNAEKQKDEGRGLQATKVKRKEKGETKRPTSFSTTANKPRRVRNNTETCASQRGETTSSSLISAPRHLRRESFVHLGIHFYERAFSCLAWVHMHALFEDICMHFHPPLLPAHTPLRVFHRSERTFFQVPSFPQVHCGGSRVENALWCGGEGGHSQSTENTLSAATHPLAHL